MNSTLEQLQDVFRDVFDDETLVIVEETTSEDIEDWDSLMHISLITAIEAAFKVRFTLEEMSSAENVGAFAKILDAKLGK